MDVEECYELELHGSVYVVYVVLRSDDGGEPNEMSIDVELEASNQQEALSAGTALRVATPQEGRRHVRSQGRASSRGRSQTVTAS